MISKRKQYVLALGLAPVAALVLQGGASSSAWAVCNNTGAQILCTGANSYTWGPGTHTTPAPNTGTLTGALEAISPGSGLTTLDLSDVNITNNHTGPNSVGINLHNNPGDTGALILNMTGTNTVDTVRGTGILVNNFATQNGNSTININSGTTTVTSDYVAGANDGDDGIEATTHGGGTATIDILDAATVNVTVSGGGNGILIQSVENSGGNIVGNILGTVTINVTDPVTVTAQTANGNNGIKAATQGDGTVDLTIGDKVEINTEGPYANGILAEAAQGYVNVTNSGTINTGIIGVNPQVEDHDSNGIKAYTATGTANPAGDVTVTNSGAITTKGNSANGILAYSESSGNTTGTVAVGPDPNTGLSGNITTYGTGAAGINAYTTATTNAVGTAGTANDVSVITKGGTITTSGDSGAAGIYATSTGPGTTGNITIDNSSKITTSGQNTLLGVGNYGIYALSDTGTIKATNSGVIQTAGATSDGVYLETGALADPLNPLAPVIDFTNTKAITTTGATSPAIWVNATGADGGVLVTNTAALSTEKAGSDGILANTKGGAIAIDNSAATGTIDTVGNTSVGISAVSQTGVIGIKNGAIINTAGTTSDGIYATTGATPAAGTNAITVTNNGAIGTAGTTSPAISANATGTTGDVLITNNSPLTTKGTNASDGILAQTKGGNITVGNTGDITTTGTGTGNYGIYALSGTSGTGIINVVNSGVISTKGTASDGIYAETDAAAVAGTPVITIGNNNAITVTGPDANAISAKATSDDGDIQITNSGPLNASANGILAQTVNGPITVTNSAGIQAGSDGILADTEGGDVSVDNSATVYGKDAGVAATATVPAGTAATATFALTNSGNISGGSAGILLSGAFVNGQITNSGTIGADNDLAINTSGMTGPVTIDNFGTINGYMTLAHVANTLNNSGTWNLRNSQGSTGTVTVSDMGEGAIVKNTGTINLLGNNGTGAAYVPLQTTTIGLRDNGEMGNANNVPRVGGGPVQGQIMGVAEFINSGTIDMRQNPVPGDVLVISGGHVAGQAGGGVYVSDGGQILMNTVLNQGGAAAQSDVLVVDSTRVQGGPTTLVISKTGLGAYTPGDGIPVVEVLNKNAGASAPGAFQLALLPEGRILTAGAYQYTLDQNGYTNTDGNWYLRDTMVQPSPTPPAPPAPPPPGSPAPAPAPAPIIVPNYRPEVPVYMTAPVLAQRMGMLMLGTYHDRVGEDRPMNWRGNNTDDDINANAKAPAPSKTQATDCDETAKNRSMAAWGRLVGQTGRAGFDDHSYSQFRDNGPDYGFNIGALQAGADLVRTIHDNLSRDNAGLYLGFMRGTADVDYVYSNGGRAGRVDMNGYSFGGYWTHKSASEWYLDGVLQGTRYDQAEAYSEGTVLNQKIYPNGYGIMASLEGGYPFGPHNHNGWRWEPQAQLIYQYVTLDNGVDRYGWVNYDDTSTWYGRIGARLTRDWVKKNEEQANCNDERKRSVWARVNLWHSFGSDADTTFTTLNGNGVTTLTTTMGHTWGQLGLGISGQLSQRLTAYIVGDYNMALTDGNGEAFSGEIGIRYEF